MNQTVENHYKIYAYKSGDSLAGFVSLFLGIFVLIDIIAIWSDYLQIQLINRVLNGEIVTIAEATANDDRQAAIGVFYLLLYLITALFFCLWIYRAHKNLPSLNAGDLKYTPGWAVGGFFVPIWNLFRPYQVMQEIWKASDPSVNTYDKLAWKQAPASYFVRFWWALWIIEHFIGRFGFRLAFYSNTIEELLTLSWMTLIASSIDILAALLAIIVIQSIAKRQQIKQSILSDTTINYNIINHFTEKSDLGNRVSQGNVKYCYNCGNEITSMAHFCSKCGHKQFE